MSTLTVQNIQGSSSTSNTINVTSGHKISGDAGSIFVPGQIISAGTYNTGTGSGARLSTTSTSWVILEINGTNQATFGRISKYSDDGLQFNKISNSSHLIISLNFPTYNAGGSNGHGIRCHMETTQGSGTYDILDITDEGPAHGWGFHGYGGLHAAMNNFTWSTYDNSNYRNTIKTSTGNMKFFFKVRNWNSGDTIYYNDYDNTYPKYGTVQVYEVAE